jgi:hypothetical protein
VLLVLLRCKNPSTKNQQQANWSESRTTGMENRHRENPVPNPNAHTERDTEREGGGERDREREREGYREKLPRFH